MEKQLKKSICFVAGPLRLSHRIFNTPPSSLSPRRASGAFLIVFQAFCTLATIVFIPTLALAAPQTWSELVALFVLIINVATPMLVALAIVLFLARGLVAMTGAGGKEQGISAAKIREFALWSIGILFVMVSIWGILALLENTFLRGDTGISSGGGSKADCTSLGGSGC